MENYKNFKFKPYIDYGDYREYEIVEFEPASWTRYSDTPEMAYVQVKGFFWQDYEEAHNGWMSFFEDGSWLIEFEYTCRTFRSENIYK